MGAAEGRGVTGYRLGTASAEGVEEGAVVEVESVDEAVGVALTFSASSPEDGEGASKAA